MKEIIIAIVAFLVGIIIGDQSNNNTIRYRDKIIYDTLIKTIRNDPIIIRTKPRIKYTRDTIVLTKPFKVKIDTVILRDTVKAIYEYPENIFQMHIFRQNDTIFIPAETIIKYQKQPWLYDLGYFITGAATGFLIGQGRNK